jgi:hypothetical protein
MNKIKLKWQRQYPTRSFNVAAIAIDPVYPEKEWWIVNYKPGGWYLIQQANIDWEPLELRRDGPYITVHSAKKAANKIYRGN